MTRDDAAGREGPPGYRLLGELGRGATAAVFRARDLRLGREVALKVVLGGELADGRGRASLRNEAAALARLGHPGVVAVYEVGEHRGLPYLALELCPGGSLSARLGGRPTAPRSAAALMERVADAVAAAHRAGLVHRDLKPANILFAADGSPKVADFGLAKSLDSRSATRTGETKGTYAYMPPEQADGARDVGTAADVYSLGAVLYECLTGRPPFLADNDAHLLWQLTSREPVPVRSLAPRTPADLETVCHKCLSKDPRRRYRDAGELAEDLRRFLDRKPVKARPLGPAERLMRWAGQNPAWATAAAVAAAAVVALAAFGWRVSGLAAELRAAMVDLESRTWQAERALSDAERARAEAVAQRGRAEENVRESAQNLERARRAVRDCLKATRHDAFRRPGLREARAVLLKAAEGYLEEFAREDPTPANRLELALARLDKAYDQTDPDDRADALASLRKAVEELTALSAESPKDLELRAEVARARNNLAVVLSEDGDKAGSEREHRAALELRERLAAEEPDSALRRDDIARSHKNLGILLSERGDRAEAVREFATAGAIWEILSDGPRRRIDWLIEAAHARDWLAQTLDESGHREASILHYGVALAMWAKIVADEPDDGNRAGLASAYAGLAITYGLAGDRAAAEGFHRPALALRRGLERRDAAGRGPRRDLARSCRQLAELLADRAPDEALALLREAGPAAADSVARSEALRPLFGREDFRRMFEEWGVPVPPVPPPK